MDCCRWVYDSDEKCWKTSCDETVRTQDVNPMIDSFEFCPFCGREIVVNPKE